MVALHTCGLVHMSSPVPTFQQSQLNMMHTLNRCVSRSAVTFSRLGTVLLTQTKPHACRATIARPTPAHTLPCTPVYPNLSTHSQPKP